MNQPLENQIAIITGASSGIGRATAHAFARHGATVVLVARRLDKLEEAVAEIQATGGQAWAVQADVASSDQISSTVQQVVKRFGRIDILFNNAGVSHVGPVDAPEFIPNVQEMLDVDFFGMVRMTQAVLATMRQQGSGFVLNMSSVVGRKAFARFGGYSSVMHAISGYTDALRQELAGTGIEVSTIYPALTQTPLLASVSPNDMPPPFRRLTPIGVEQVATAALRGAIRRPSRIVVPWQPRLLMLADAVSPRLGDLVLRLVGHPWFGRLLGTFRGHVYQHNAETPT